jgi:membrane protein YqaA with SNARE-associated domain
MRPNQSVRLLRPFLHFIFYLGYFGPLAMGILDSSFLILPFGNDLVVVGLVASHPHRWMGYVVMAAIGSTIGALLLAAVARKLGEEGFARFAGKRGFERMKRRVGKRAGIAVAIAGLAPPPFPFTTVIAGVAALGYPVWRILIFNFFARLTRFTLLALLAMQFGREVLRIAQSAPFEWAMAAFITVCAVASVFSILHWLKKPRVAEPVAKPA